MADVLFFADKLTQFKLTNQLAESICFRQSSATVECYVDDWTVIERMGDIWFHTYTVDSSCSASWRVFIWSKTSFEGIGDTFANAFPSHLKKGGPAYKLTVNEVEWHWIVATDTLIGIDRVSKVVEVYCKDIEAALMWGHTVIRQLMTDQLLSGGAVHTHAAAVAFHGHGVLISGFRQQGKTSTLIAMLHHLGCDYVGPDRLFLSPEGSGFVAFVWPMIMRARVGTLCAHSQLRDLVPKELVTSLAGLSKEELWYRSEKVKIYPGQLRQILSFWGRGQMISRCYPKIMLWPQLRPGQHSVSTERVSYEEIVATLVDSRMFTIDADGVCNARLETWVAGTNMSQDESQVYLERMAHKMAILVPCYRLYGGGDSKALADHLKATVLQELLNSEGDTSYLVNQDKCLSSTK